MKSVRLLAVLAVLGMASSAHAEFGILGGINMASPKVDTATIKSEMGIAGGLYFSRGLSPLLTLELDALYIVNKYKATGTVPAAFDQTFESKAIQFPLIARFNFSPFWNIGAGAYYAYVLGKLKTTDNLASTSSESEVSKKSDIGAVGSVQIRIPAGPVKVLVDGRYTYGFTDLGGGVKNKGIQGFAGLGWGW